ncbi:hypothetical protein ATANTOWER_015483 [Ataeniobius toweri]|uniref:Uncharacterized protein n=1 Tax=Ataeniobius toweri TaxID=208326 RepID=A0ABU7C8R3_9TELE|nr:hypothetical protein [Ataeniobius toweri]
MNLSSELGMQPDGSGVKFKLVLEEQLLSLVLTEGLKQNQNSFPDYQQQHRSLWFFCGTISEDHLHRRVGPL